MRRILPAVALVLMASPAVAGRLASSPIDVNPWPVADERYNAYSCVLQYIAASGPNGLVPVTIIARAGSRALQRAPNNIGRGVVSLTLTGTCDGACHAFVCLFDVPNTIPASSWRAAACVFNAEAQTAAEVVNTCMPAN